jgi:hypothetical protein
MDGTGTAGTLSKRADAVGHSSRRVSNTPWPASYQFYRASLGEDDVVPGRDHTLLFHFGHDRPVEVYVAGAIVGGKFVGKRPPERHADIEHALGLADRGKRPERGAMNPSAATPGAAAPGPRISLDLLIYTSNDSEQLMRFWAPHFDGALVRATTFDKNQPVYKTALSVGPLSAPRSPRGAGRSSTAPDGWRYGTLRSSRCSQFPETPQT